MTGTKCWVDKSGEIDFHAGKWLEEGEFPLLSEVAFLYTFVDPPRLDSNGMEIIGQAKKLPNGARDVFGFDFMIEIANERWKEMSEEERSRLVWHELRHCAIKLNANGDVVTDSCERVKIYLDKHDINLATFSEEITRFGLSKKEEETVRLLAKTLKRPKKEEDAYKQI